MKRKTISKKQRFEVFKRDRFRCQYCGRPSPDVLLAVDHIDPVKNGGGNEIANLITSCQDCNSGKGATLLDDNTTVAKMRAQLEELQERRNQLAMMLEWKRGCDSLATETTREVVGFLEERISPIRLSEFGISGIGKLIKKYSAERVLDAIRLSVEKFAILDQSGDTTKESAEKVISKLPGFCFLASCGPDKRDAYYIRGIIKRRFSDKISGWSAERANVNLAQLLELISSALGRGIEFLDLKKAACSASSYSAFGEYLQGVCNAPTIS